jgi:hypothetical protein
VWCGGSLATKLLDEELEGLDRVLFGPCDDTKAWPWRDVFLTTS